MVHDIISEIKKLFPEDHRFFLLEIVLKLKLSPKYGIIFRFFHFKQINK
jgi:hypothetical protein